MREDIQKWVEALESGDYKQTKGTLKRKRKDGKVGYCCLGVYAEVCLNENVDAVNFESSYPGNLVIYNKIDEKVGYRFSTHLTKINDEGQEFKTIAKVIREQYDGV